MQPRSSRRLNNHQYTKEELIKNNNITSAIFLLDQKVEPLEFLDRLKAVALEFNKLTDTQKMILKHWLRNTVDATIAENAVEKQTYFAESKHFIVIYIYKCKN